MANRISLFSKWLFIIVVFQIICIIGLSVGSEDADLGISSSKLKGSSEDLKSDFNFELERQSPAGSLNSKLKTSEELKLKKNGNLLENNENDEYIVQDNESEDDGYIVQDNESENEYIVQDDESEDDGYIVQDEKNDLDLKLQSKISFKSTSDVHTPDDNRVQSTKSVDDSNGIPTGRKDVYHYGNASPKTQSSGKRPEASGSSDDGKIHGVDSTQPPKKSELSTWEKAQIMMMKRNKNKMEKDTKQKADEILVSTPIISPEAETPNFVSEKSLGVEHSDSSQRIERSEDIDFPQFGNLSLVSNDVVIGDSAIEESREKSIEQPISIAKEDRHESMITAGTGSDGETLKGDSDNYLENIKDTDKEVPHQDWDSEINATEASLIEETHQSKNIKSSQSESAGIIDHEAGDGISEDNIDKSQGNDEDQDNDDAGDQESDDVGIESDDVGIESDDVGIESDDIGIESDTDIENVKEVKNEMYTADSVDSNVISSAKDYFEDEIINSSNSEEGGTHNLMNESINDIKDDGDLKPTTSVEKSVVEEFNMARDVLTRDGLKVDGEHVHLAEDASDSDITANDTDGYQAKDAEDIDEMETDSDNNVDKNMDDKESETVGRDIVSTAGNVALFDEVTLDSHRESPDDPSANDQTNLDKDDSLVIIEDVIKEDDVETSEEINKDTQSGNSVLNDKNSSEFNEDAYDDDNDIKQDYENGAKEDNKDGGEGTWASNLPIKDVNGNSDSDKIDGKEIDEYTKNIETKEDNMDIVEDEDDEKLMDDEGSEDLDNDTGNDEDVEVGGDIVEGDMDEKEDVGNDYESVEKDDENVVKDATEVDEDFVEEGDEKGSKDDDVENVDEDDEKGSKDDDVENVDEDDEKLNGDSTDRDKNIGNDDESIEQVHKNILKEEEDNEDVVKDGDEEIDSKDSDENTENVEVIKDKEDVEEDNEQVVDKLPSSEDKGISDDNKSTKNNDENVNRGGEKGPKDAEKYTENEVSEVSRDIDKDDEIEKEILADEPSKDEDEDISDVDDFEGIKKDDISVTKNDEVIAKDNNNDGDDVRIVEDINEKDNKTSPIGYDLDTNGMVNETISDHTTTRNETHFEQINTQKMPKDDSYGEGITAKKAQADEDDWTGTDVIAEGKMLKKDVINRGDAPGLTFEDVPTYVEINRDRDERGTEAKADIDDGSINVGVVDAGHPAAFDPTPASSHEADLSKNDATAESEEMPIEAHEKDSETSVKDNNLENFDVSIDKDYSLKEGSDLETSFSREAEKESAMDKDLSNGIAEVDKDISDAIEAIESSNVESEEVMPDSTADKNEDEVCPNIAGERKAISTPEAQDKVGKEGSEELELKSPIESDEKNLDEIPQEEPREPTGQFLSDTSEDVEAEAEIQPAGHDSYFPDIPVQEENLKITPEVEDEKVTENKRVVENKKADEDEQLTSDGEKVAAAEDMKGDGKVEKEIDQFFQDTTLQSTKRDWVFFTIKPYFTLLKTVVKKLDPFVTGIIFMLPPSLQNIFLKAPFNMYPTHAFLLFTLSCLSLFVISFSKIFKGSRWHSKSKELKEMLFEMKGVLLLSQVERDEAEKKLQDLKAKLKQKDDDLESGTVEMNRNLKALIKECDTLKEEVSRRMGSSKEMKSETKKAESDIQKQSLVNKELQESIALAKNHIQQLQDKRDQLQSSIDESELNSMKLEEKIQCLSEDVGAVEESHDRLRTEVESKEKESVELQTAVDFLKQKCSKKSGDIQTKEKENKILREAIVQLKIMKHIREEDESDDDDGSDDDKKKERLEERIKHLIYIAQMRSRMDEIEEEKESLKKSLAGAAEKKMDLNDELKRTMEEIKKVEQLREDAEHQATASTMKIDVLSDYYKQREKEYNKMLQEKEAKEKAISSQKKSANERYREVDKMVADYKNQVEVLNQELERIGIHYEKQMALQENKLQENLVFVKQTERDYNIKVKEAEIMRQKLLQYRDRINLLESMMASHKSTETLNTSQTKEDIRPASRNVLLRENMPSPPNFMPPSFSPHPSSLGPNPPQFFNPHPFLLRHPFIPPRLPMRSREDSPTLQRFRDLPSEDFLDERGHYPTLRNRSPLRFGPSPASRNRSSPSDLKEKYTPMTNNRPLDPFYMEKGDGSHRTSNDK